MSIQQLINQSLLKEQEERSKRERSGKFNPSSLGLCYRKQIFNKRNEPITNPFDDRDLRIFKCGKLFHDFVQGFIPKKQIEVKVENDDCLGYADVVTEDSVADIKSCHSNSFWYTKKANYDIKKEKRHNWLQLAFYAWQLQKPKMVLVQISKDDLTMSEDIQFTNNWLNELQHELDMLNWYWKQTYESGELPPALPVFPTECEKYCLWFNKCKEVEHDGHRLHITEQPKSDSKKSK